MNIKTFTTKDGENILNFGSTEARYYWCKNIGETTLYVSANDNVKVDGDGVAILPAGEAVMIENFDNFIYVLGAGKIEVYETNTETCPFKSALTSKGGEGGNEVDSELSETSENAIQNKAVAKAIKGGNLLSGSTSYTVTDSVEYPLVGLKVFGKSTQDGTPTPENPVEIVSVVEPTVTVSNDTDSVSLTLPYTLNAIPVSSGGNVVIDGQEYIADYVDFERGVKVQNTGNITFDGSDDEKWQPYSGEGTTNFTSFALVNFTENSAKNWGKSDLICNRFVSTDNANNDYYYKIKPTIMIFKDTYNNVLGITLPNSIASTVSELRAWLADNSVTVIYKLKTCIETPIPESELQAYRQLQTFNGVTNISNDKGAVLSVQYCTNKALSTCVTPITTGLQKQIDDLKAAVLSLGGNV